jgi:hypothetical protein
MLIRSLMTQLDSHAPTNLFSSEAAAVEATAAAALVVVVVVSEVKVREVWWL